ncbi:MAG: aldose epimerase family protein [Acidimicrobiia bacterium]
MTIGDDNAFTLTNREGSSVVIWSYGAAIAAIRVPDRRGQFDNIVLGYDTPAGYDVDNTYFGTCIGRYAGRIRNASFDLDGKRVHVDANNGSHCLHGGPRGFDRSTWQLIARTDYPAAVRLRHVSPDGDQGFPGRLTMEVMYTFDDDRVLTIDTDATADAPTVFNPTNHTYFNLGGHVAGSIGGHVVTIAADRFCAVDAELVDTGEQIDVIGTPFDFRRPRTLSEAWAEPHEQLRRGYGFDHAYVLRRSVGPAVRMCDPVGGRAVEVTTDRPAVRLYTANGLDVAGRTGARYGPRAGVCLETGGLPAPSGKSVPAESILRPGVHFFTRTCFRFSYE